jgi:hypothetical protein
VLLSVQLQILLEQKRLAEVQTILETHASLSNRMALQPYVTSCLQAMQARQQKREADVSASLDAALGAAEKDPRALAFVADYAEFLGAHRVALTAQMRRLEWPPVMLHAASEAVRLARVLKDDAALHAAVRRLAEALPGDSALRALEAYQAALVRAAPLSSREVLIEFSKEHPSELLYQGALALVELRAGRAVEALTTLEAHPSEWSKAEPRWRAVYVAALSANQQREAARTMARQIPVEGLSPSERSLIDDVK